MGKNWWIMAAAAGILFLSSGSLFGQVPGYKNWQNGMDYYKKREYKSAAEEFVKAFESDRSFARYQELVGIVLVDKTKEYDRAIKLLEGVPKKQQSSHALYWLGKAYYKRGITKSGDSGRPDFAKALGYAERAYDIEPTAKARELLKEIRSKIPRDTIWKTLGVVLVIIVISVAALVVLKRFVFPQPSALRDVILFLVMVLVMVFSAALLGIISGQQFADIIKRMFDTLKALFPGSS